MIETKYYIQRYQYSKELFFSKKLFNTALNIYGKLYSNDFFISDCNITRISPRKCLFRFTVTNTIACEYYRLYATISEKDKQFIEDNQWNIETLEPEIISLGK